MPYVGRTPTPSPVTIDDIPANSIDASKIIDGSIEVSDIKDNSITDAKLNSTKLDGIETGATNYIHPTTHATADIADNAITDAKLNSTKLDGIADSANNYSHPAAHTVSEVTGLQGLLDGKTTETYVNTQVAALVASSPATLDTLNELAAALGNDPNFATTVTNSIGTKLPLAGGIITGNLEVSTASSGYIKSTAVGDHFPGINIKRSGGVSKADYEWSMQLGSGGNLNIRDLTNNYYPIIMNNTGDTYIGNGTAGSGISTMVIKELGSVGIGTNSPSSKLDIRSDNSQYPLKLVHNITDPALDYYFAQIIDGNFSGVSATGGDREQGGLFIDVDSSTTGGDTTNEHRVYGLNVDTRATGDSDLVYGGRFVTESVLDSVGSTTELKGISSQVYARNSAGTVTNLYGSSTFAYIDTTGTGTVTTAYGSYNKAATLVGHTGNVGTIRGVFGEVESNGSSTISTARGFESHIDSNAGTITNGQLFYGSYAISAGTVTNAYGLHINGEDKNYLSGKLGIGTTSPGSKLDVFGDVSVGNPNFGLTLDGVGAGAGLSGTNIHFNGNTTTPTVRAGHSSYGASGILHKWGGDIAFVNKTGVVIAEDAVEERMRITSAGNVGIGTDDPSASLQVGNAADQHEWITVNSLGGYYSGIKLARGAGDWSSTGNNNYGMLVTDGGFEISKFTNKGNNTNGRDTFLVLDDTEVNVEKPFGLLSAASDPTGTRAGQLYYNSFGQKVKFYDGSTWQDVSSDGIIKSNLLLHWDMTNGSSYSGSGSTVNDISGNGYNGTIQGNPTYSSSNNGYMIFDGYGDYISSSFTAPAGARAFGMWVYYSSTTQPAGESFQLQGIQAGGGYTYQGIKDGGNVYFYIGTGTGGEISHQLSSGQWYYQVLTFDGSSYAVYVNGSLIQSGSASSGTTSTTFQAAAINVNHRLYGYGSEWQFYGQNLTSAEVQQNFNAGRGRYGI